MSDGMKPPQPSAIKNGAEKAAADDFLESQQILHFFHCNGRKKERVRAPE
jgi:hypothetical protein